MSLIGPRPEVLDRVERYEREIPGYRRAPRDPSRHHRLGAGERPARRQERIDRRAAALRHPVPARLEPGARRAHPAADRVDGPARHAPDVPGLSGPMAPGGELRRALSNLSLKALSLGLERGCRLAGHDRGSAGPRAGRVRPVRVRIDGHRRCSRWAPTSGLGLWTTRALARDRRRWRAHRSRRSGAPGARGAPLRAGRRRSATARRAIARCASPSRSSAWPRCSTPSRTTSAPSFAGTSASRTKRGSTERAPSRPRSPGSTAPATSSRSLTGLCAGLAVGGRGGAALYGLVLIARLHPRPQAAARHALDRSARPASRSSSPFPSGSAGSCRCSTSRSTRCSCAPSPETPSSAPTRAAYKFFEGAHLLPAVVLAVTFPQLARAHADPGSRAPARAPLALVSARARPARRGRVLRRGPDAGRVGLRPGLPAGRGVAARAGARNAAALPELRPHALPGRARSGARDARGWRS